MLRAYGVRRLGRRFDGLFGGFAEVVGADKGEAGLGEEAFALLDVRADEAGDDRNVDVHRLVRVDDALGDDVDAGHAPEDVDEDRLDIRVLGDNSERRDDASGVVDGGDVEEVGGLAAGELDSVHGGHGKSGAVDNAADAAVELDVVGDAGFLRPNLQRVLLVDVAELCEVLVAVEGVVVEVELGVGREEAAVLGDDERVDLGEGPVALGEGGVKAADELCPGAHHVAAQADRGREVATLERLEADRRVDGRAVD
jgi:hypothetical protein